MVQNPNIDSKLYYCHGQYDCHIMYTESQCDLGNPYCKWDGNFCVGMGLCQDYYDTTDMCLTLNGCIADKNIKLKNIYTNYKENINNIVNIIGIDYGYFDGNVILTQQVCTDDCYDSEGCAQCECCVGEGGGPPCYCAPYVVGVLPLPGQGTGGGDDDDTGGGTGGGGDDDWIPVEEGGECENDNWCATDLICISGICGVPGQGAQDDACDNITASNQCEEGLICWSDIIGVGPYYCDSLHLTGEPCAYSDHCEFGYCWDAIANVSYGTCTAGNDGDGCQVHWQCQSGSCYEGVCAPLGEVTDACTTTSNCVDGLYCVGGVCSEDSLCAPCGAGFSPGYNGVYDDTCPAGQACNFTTYWPNQTDICTGTGESLGGNTDGHCLPLGQQNDPCIVYGNQNNQAAGDYLCDGDNGYECVFPFAGSNYCNMADTGYGTIELRIDDRDDYAYAVNTNGQGLQVGAGSDLISDVPFPSIYTYEPTTDGKYFDISIKNTTFLSNGDNSGYAFLFFIYGVNVNDVANSVGFGLTTGATSNTVSITPLIDSVTGMRTGAQITGTLFDGAGPGTYAQHNTFEPFLRIVYDYLIGQTEPPVVTLENGYFVNSNSGLFPATPFANELEIEISGCTDPTYIDYNENATVDDGTCGTGLTQPIIPDQDEFEEIIMPSPFNPITISVDCYPNYGTDIDGQDVQFDPVSLFLFKYNTGVALTSTGILNMGGQSFGSYTPDDFRIIHVEPYFVPSEGPDNAGLYRVDIEYKPDDFFDGADQILYACASWTGEIKEEGEGEYAENAFFDDIYVPVHGIPEDVVTDYRIIDITVDNQELSDNFGYEEDSNITIKQSLFAHHNPMSGMSLITGSLQNTKESFKSNDIDGRPSLGIFYHDSDNPLRDDFISNLSAPFIQISKPNLLENGNGRMVEELYAGNQHDTWGTRGVVAGKDYQFGNWYVDENKDNYQSDYQDVMFGKDVWKKEGPGRNGFGTTDIDNCIQSGSYCLPIVAATPANCGPASTEIQDFSTDNSGISDTPSDCVGAYKPRAWQYMNYKGVPASSGNYSEFSFEELDDSYNNHAADHYVFNPTKMYAGLNKYWNPWGYTRTTMFPENYNLLFPAGPGRNGSPGDSDYDDNTDTANENWIAEARYYEKLYWAHWTHSPECYSYGKCLAMVAPPYHTIPYNFSSGPPSTKHDYSNHYKWLNQVQKFLDTEQIDILPQSSIKISFWMKTTRDTITNKRGMIEVSVVRGGNPARKGAEMSQPSEDNLQDGDYIGPTGGYDTPNLDYYDPQGYYNSIPNDGIIDVWSYTGASNRFINTELNKWEKMEYTVNLGGSFVTNLSQLKNLYLVVQYANDVSSTIWLDNFSVTEAYDFKPDVDVRIKKEQIQYGTGLLTEYHDPNDPIGLEKYNDTVAPLEAGFYFYPRYNSNETFNVDIPITYNDFRNGMYYLYDVDWGDGSSNEFTSEPEKLGNNKIIYHTYEISGIYEVTGTMLRMKPNRDYNPLGVAFNQRFTLRININEGSDEDFSYFNSDGFSFIPYKNILPVVGGYNQQSIYYKSLKRNIGIISDDIKVDVKFNQISDKLKTEIALQKIEDNFYREYKQWEVKYYQQSDNTTMFKNYNLYNLPPSPTLITTTSWEQDDELLVDDIYLLGDNDEGIFDNLDKVFNIENPEENSITSEGMMFREEIPGTEIYIPSFYTAHYSTWIYVDITGGFVVDSTLSDDNLPILTFDHIIIDGFQSNDSAHLYINGAEIARVKHESSFYCREYYCTDEGNNESYLSSELCVADCVLPCVLEDAGDYTNEYATLEGCLSVEQTVDPGSPGGTGDSAPITGVCENCTEITETITPYRFDFSPGWYKIDIVFNSQGGEDFVKIGWNINNTNQITEGGLLNYEVLPHFLTPRYEYPNYKVDTSNANDLDFGTEIYSGNQFSGLVEHLGDSIGDLDMSDIKLFTAPHRMGEMLGCRFCFKKVLSDGNDPFPPDTAGQYLYSNICNENGGGGGGFGDPDVFDCEELGLFTCPDGTCVQEQWLCFEQSVGTCILEDGSIYGFCVPESECVELDDEEEICLNEDGTLCAPLPEGRCMLEYDCGNGVCCGDMDVLQCGCGCPNPPEGFYYHCSAEDAQGSCNIGECVLVESGEPPPEVSNPMGSDRENRLSGIAWIPSCPRCPDTQVDPNEPVSLELSTCADDIDCNAYLISCSDNVGYTVDGAESAECTGFGTCFDPFGVNNGIPCELGDNTDIEYPHGLNEECTLDGSCLRPEILVESCFYCPKPDNDTFAPTLHNFTDLSAENLSIIFPSGQNTCSPEYDGNGNNINEYYQYLDASQEPICNPSIPFSNLTECNTFCNTLYNTECVSHSQVYGNDFDEESQTNPELALVAPRKFVDCCPCVCDLKKLEVVTGADPSWFFNAMVAGEIENNGMVRTSDGSLTPECYNPTASDGDCPECQFEFKLITRFLYDPNYSMINMLNECGISDEYISELCGPEPDGACCRVGYDDQGFGCDINGASCNCTHCGACEYSTAYCCNSTSTYTNNPETCEYEECADAVAMEIAEDPEAALTAACMNTTVLIPEIPAPCNDMACHDPLGCTGGFQRTTMVRNQRITDNPCLIDPCSEACNENYPLIEEQLLELFGSFDNPGSPRYWANIIPEEYYIFDRVGINIDNLGVGGAEIVDVNASQEWIGENEYDNTYYYPVLPKINKYGNFNYDYFNNRWDYTVIGNNEITNIPFSLVSPATNDITVETLSTMINTNQLESNVLDDLAGLSNYGFAFSDYRPKFDNQTLKPKKTKNTNRIRNSKKNRQF